MSTRAETGYGYIETGFDNDVIKFYEKPDEATAQKMFLSKNFLWNSGIFLVSAETIMQLGEAFIPETYNNCCQAITYSRTDMNFLRLGEDYWEKIEPISIDYSIMEKAKNLSVLKFDGHWSDVGDWQAFKSELQRLSFDGHPKGNVIQGRVVELDTHGCLLHSEPNGPLLAVLGVSNLAIVAMKDAVLVADLNRGQEIKELVASMNREEFEEADNHRKDFRPWGWFENLVVGDSYKVKQILVYPGGRLSLQSHKHRSEHWVVTSGEALVQLDEDEFFVKQNESIYIEVGHKHRLSNIHSEPLILIEVQTGNYLGEDDITRYDDLYSRG